MRKNYPQYEITFILEFVSTRIKHTRKNNNKEKTKKLFIQLSTYVFNGIRLNMV